MEVKNMNNSTLETLWELYQSEYPLKVCTKEKELIKEIEEYGDKLCASLDEQQKEMLQRYQDLWDRVSCFSEKEAFIKGVKFATGFLLEALDNE